jgi:hypothetical protein
LAARDDALQALQDALQGDQHPALGTPAVERLLDDNLLFETWQANHSYAYGTRVSPVERNGHVYECIVPGTSGATAPAFDTGIFVVPRNAVGKFDLSAGNVVVDNTVTWREVSIDSSSPYDVDAAAKAGWIQKAARVAGYVNWSADGRSMSDGATMDNCLKMAAQFDKPMV